MARKPAGNEDEYIARNEFAMKKALEEKRHKMMKEDEKRALKELHYMRCPKCGMDLIEVDYQTIKVDKCSSCDGVWLDAGELETVSKLEKGILDKFFSVFKKE
ncbi:hypothetical protein MCHI_003153 [Candidatus Magnetoovum chiemensis]|nr:hypothetical protein MCHI_003153 [Candidatus Magnetoovum chiemensis]